MRFKKWGCVSYVQVNLSGICYFTWESETIKLFEKILHYIIVWKQMIVLYSGNQKQVHNQQLTSFESYLETESSNL